MIATKRRPTVRTRRTLSGMFAVLAGAALLSMTVVAPKSEAMRHLRLVSAFPAKDTVLTSSPDAVRLWLSEPTQAPVSKVTVTGASGAAVPLEKLTRENSKDAPLVAKLVKPVGNGRYVVTWKAMSKDGHVVNGTYRFQVKAAH